MELLRDGGEKMKYIECDRCGCIHREGKLDSVHIIPTSIERREQNGFTKDLCDECYGAVKAFMNKRIPTEEK